MLLLRLRLLLLLVVLMQLRHTLLLWQRRLHVAKMTMVVVMGRPRWGTSCTTLRINQIPRGVLVMVVVVMATSSLLVPNHYVVLLVVEGVMMVLMWLHRLPVTICRSRLNLRIPDLEHIRLRRHGMLLV